MPTCKNEKDEIWNQISLQINFFKEKKKGSSGIYFKN
jgi:hypothetical protein